MEASPTSVVPAYVPDAPSPTTTLANTKGNAPEDLSFGDMLETLNPLQHLPIVGTIYREVTGDDIKTLPRLLGGALFGGVIGFISAAVDSIVKDASGATPGEHLLHALGFGHEKTPDVTVTELPAGSATDAPAAKTEVSNAIVLPGGVVPVPQLLIDEARNNPKSFFAASSTPQAATVQPAVARPTASATPPAALQTAASAGPTEFFRSLQRPHTDGHTTVRPLPMLSTIETAPRAKSKTTAPGASADEAAVAAPVQFGPATVGAPTSILPQMQTQAEAQQAFQANPNALPAAMMAALDKYQAMKRAEGTPQISVTH